MQKKDKDLVPKLLVVEDRQGHSSAISATLTHWGYSSVVCNLSEGREKVATQSPDLIILDASSTGVSGLELCSDLARNSFTNHIPIIVVGLVPRHDKVVWFQHGATDCLDTNSNAAELKARILAHLSRINPRDEVTHLRTGAHLHLQLDAWLATNLPTAALLVELDRFEEYRSIYGQDAANHVLRTTADLIVDSLPNGDDAEAARLGVDNFMVVLPHDGAKTFAQTLIDRFAALGLPLITVSGALVTNKNRVLFNYMQVTSLLLNLMKQVQAQGGNRLAFEQA